MRKIFFLIGILTFFLSSCNSQSEYGATPIYQGMDVASVSNTQSSFPLSFRSYGQTTFTSGINDEIPTIDISEQPDFTYFANPNEEILVRVYLTNPDSQVILRFKLNGVIYQSFEFQEGSNSELLIVKVNAGAISGTKELTIDEIKYVENVSNLIKDAEFAGDRTIQMGVTYQYPLEALVSNEVITATSYQSTITITDTDDLISVYENPPVFYLFDGSSIVYTQILNVGSNTIEYQQLKTDQSFEYAIAMTYDLLDGEGVNAYIALQHTKRTEKIVEITSVISTQTSLAFDLDINDQENVGSLTAIELYQGETLVESLTDLTLRTFENLLSNNNYEIKVTYIYDLNDGVGELTYNNKDTATTLAKATPSVELTNIAATQESVSFELDITDTDQVGEVIAIELYQGETLVESLTDLTVRTFENLLSNNAYEIKVTYTYDLNDGVGEQSYDKIFQKNFKTISYNISDLYLDLVNISHLGIGIIDDIPELIAIDKLSESHELIFRNSSNVEVDFKIEYFPVFLESLGNFIFLEFSEDYVINFEVRYGVEYYYPTDSYYVVIEKDNGKMHQISKDHENFQDFGELYRRLQLSDKITFKDLDLYYIEGYSPFKENNQAIITNEEGSRLYYLFNEYLVLFSNLGGIFEFTYSGNLNREISYSFHYFDSLNEVYYYKHSILNEFVAFSMFDGYLTDAFFTSRPSFILPDSRLLYAVIINGVIEWYTLNSKGERIQFQMMNPLPSWWNTGFYIGYQFVPIGKNRFLISKDKIYHHNDEQEQTYELFIDENNNIFINSSDYNVPLLRNIIYLFEYYIGFYERKIYKFDYSTESFSTIDIPDNVRAVSNVFYDPNLGIILEGIGIDFNTVYMKLENLEFVNTEVNQFYIVRI